MVTGTNCRDFEGECPARYGSGSRVEEDETPLRSAEIRLLRTTGVCLGHEDVSLMYVEVDLTYTYYGGVSLATPISYN